MNVTDYRGNSATLLRAYRRRIVSLTLLSLLLVFLFSMPAKAHEYWLYPLGDQWEVGGVLALDIRNGDNFVGSAFPYDPSGLERGSLITPTHDGKKELSGRLGDYPAVKFQVDEPGLHLVSLETTRRNLTYDSLCKFETFLDYHGITDVLARHEQRGLSESDVVEHYYRFCKALVLVNANEVAELSRQNGLADTALSNQVAPESENTDTALEAQGQRLEIVALNNPIGAEQLRLQLQFEGQPLGNRQIELFHENAEKLTARNTAVSDTNGYVTFDVSGEGNYLVNSVHVLEPDDGSEADWISLWSSLFFKQPS